MAITRTYRTIEECTRLWLAEDWQFIPEFLLYGQDIECMGIIYTDDDEEVYGPVGMPMWGTVFTPCQLDSDWIEAHAQEVAELGFTLIYLEGELFALGIDGAGYSFYEHHWIPLYKLRGFKWHDEEKEEGE